MMDTSIRENIDIRYKNIWKRKQEWVKEEYMDEGHPEVILSVFAVVQDQDKSTSKKEDVTCRKVLRKNENQEEKVNENQVLEIVLTICATTQNHDESRGKEKDVIFQEEDEKEYYSAS
jgi:hypothetical protein